MGATHTPAIVTNFPNVSRVQLEALVVEREVRRGKPREALDSPRLKNRGAVNMLRHEFTNYDEMSDLEGAHRLVLQAIAAQYPWLAQECQYQLTQRSERRQLAVAMVETYEAERDEAMQRRHALAAASKDAIAQFHVGDEIVVVLKGREYSGVVSWVGRSRVEVVYRLRSGAEQTRKFYASEVRTTAPTR